MIATMIRIYRYTVIQLLVISIRILIYDDGDDGDDDDDDEEEEEKKTKKKQEEEEDGDLRDIAMTILQYPR